MSMMSCCITSPHRSLASRILSVMHATHSDFLMTIFLFLYLNSVTLKVSTTASILIAVLSSSCSSLLVTVQASAPYINTGLIIVLYTFPFRYFGIFASHKTPARSFHFFQAAMVLFLNNE